MQFLAVLNLFGVLVGAAQFADVLAQRPRIALAADDAKLAKVSPDTARTTKVLDTDPFEGVAGNLDKGTAASQDGKVLQSASLLLLTRAWQPDSDRLESLRILVRQQKVDGAL